MIRLAQIKGKGITKALHEAKDGTFLIDIKERKTGKLKVLRDCGDIVKATKTFNSIRV